MTTAALPDARWRQRPGFDQLCDLLGATEDSVRLVGGAVRDGLIGLDVSDIDLATIFPPQEVMKRLEAANIKVVPTGITHGTVTAVIDHRPVEITTLRCDVSTDGRRATIAYTEDWREDASRRDFTINALYAEPLTGVVHDYFGGLEDLATRTVRFIGDPATRIAEDHLRILRYFRFLARFGTLPPDATSYSACVARANSLMALSRERIADELLKLLALPAPADVVSLMIDGGIFAPILPEIDAAGLNRLRSLLARESAAAVSDPSPLLRLAALLPQSASVGEQVAARLKLSNKARKRIGAALAPRPSNQRNKELVFRVGKEAAIDQMLLDADGNAKEIIEIEHWAVPEFPVGGRDLLDMGIKAGPDVALLLGRIKEQWIVNKFPARSEALDIARAHVAEFLRDNQNS